MATQFLNKSQVRRRLLELAKELRPAKEFSRVGESVYLKLQATVEQWLRHLVIMQSGPGVTIQTPPIAFKVSITDQEETHVQ